MITRKFHPTKTYTLRPWRAKKLEMVNRLVRGGATYKEIAEMLNTSATTVARYHVGYADNCLDYAKGYRAGWGCGYAREPLSVMYKGAACAI